MASTTALFTALSGLNAHARRLDVIGNNIANVNTTSFKSSRTIFQDMFYRDMSIGTPPGEGSGGANPMQVGLGVRIGAIQRNMTAGTINPTGDSRDLAIDGGGFFVVRSGNSTFYTRDGAFRLDGQNMLTAPTGHRLLGYPVDAEFNVRPGALQELSVPLGRLTIAEPTQNVTIAGNLDAGGDLPGRGTSISLGGAAGAGWSLIGGGIPSPTTLLTQLEDPAAAGAPVFEVGQTLELSGAGKGEKTIRDAELRITAATTVQDVMNWLSAALGIQNTGPNPDGLTPGVTLNATTGAIEIVGNTGTVNALDVAAADLRLLHPSGTLARLPFVPETTAEADGASLRTTLNVFDSLGTPLNVDVTLVLDGKDATGTSWRYYIESADDTDLSPAIGAGVLRFDTNGQLIDTDPIAVTLDRGGAGADTPVVFNLRFGGPEGRTTALADGDAEIYTALRDGLPIGTLASFAVAADGTIQGAFSNGAIRTLGQVALATVTNPEGLVDVGANLWTVGPNAGELVIGAPGTAGSGAIVGGALELANVDLGQEFIDLITTQTGYSANTRVIQTTNDLMQQLLVIGR